MGWLEAAWNHFLRSGPFMLPLLGALQIIAYAAATRRKKLAFAGILLILFLIAVYQPLATILPALSTDSFREGAHFDLSEAWFYLRTLRGAAYGWMHGASMVAWLAIFLAYAAAFVIAARWLSKRVSWATAGRLTAASSALLILPFVGFSAWQAGRGYAEASEEIAQAEHNFASAPDLLEVAADPDNDLAVVLYIGESTTRMHWSLYGYPRATTPALDRLAKQGDLIVFQHVSATFPHTSSSLLEALSLPTKSATSDALPEPIFEQSRVSIVDALNQAGIATSLYSNQARHGSWNLASEIILRHASDLNFSTNRLLGNLDYLDDTRPYDHQYLARFWAAVESGRTRGSRLLVFHSYAGHGPYAEFIPPSARTPVDGFYRGLSDDAVLGTGQERARMDEVESYDSAMRYVADNIADSIAHADKAQRPMVLVYFSDHGESVFTGMGHDSARYSWPMGAVPLVMHFNPAARAKYPGLVERYRLRAAADPDASLANLPGLLFDLLGVKARYRAGDRPGEPVCAFGSRTCMPRYLVVKRQVGGALSYVASPLLTGPAPPAMVDETGRIVAQYNLARQLSSVEGSPQVCVHRNNSLARVIRARAISDCLELDVTMEDEGPEVYHPPSPKLGFPLVKAISAVGTRPATFWLDSKNIDQPARCIELARFVSAHSAHNLSFLAEFPTTSVERLPELRGCFSAFEQAGVMRSFYVPSELALPCAKGDGSACRQLDTMLDRVARSGLFTDISFEYGALPAIRRNSASTGFRWNTWYAPDEAIRTMHDGRFRLVIPFPRYLNWN